MQTLQDVVNSPEFKIPYGLMYLFEQFHEDMVELDPDYELLLGRVDSMGLRIDVSVKTSSSIDADDIVYRYEHLSRKTCIECGEPGYSRPYLYTFFVYCDDHAEEKKAYSHHDIPDENYDMYWD